MMPKTIAPAALQPLLIKQSTVIDVRTPAEFKAAHVNGAQLHPLDSLDPDAFCKTHGTEEPVYILCQSGQRASIAAQRLIQAGHQHTVVVEGGTAAAIKHGIDIAYGHKAALSIERQVRIAAGSIVLAGTLLGAFIHPALLIVPGFVGAGLAFAGITDTCGMALALTKCPWNQ